MFYALLLGSGGGGARRVRGRAVARTKPVADLEKVVTSPHSTASVPGLTNELQAELFCNNLRRYLNEAPLINELDKKLLY